MPSLQGGKRRSLMNKYKTLLSNTLLISIGTFGSKILVFFMVRFYTGYLTPSDYGTADLITQTANLLFPIISLGITDGVFRFEKLRVQRDIVIGDDVDLSPWL